MALLAMQVYFKRGIQGVIKITSDDLASPAQNFYSAQAGKTVDPQILGVEDVGLLQYIQREPTNVTKRQEIVTTELARGQRGFVIKDDNTTTTGNWTVRYESKNSTNFGNERDKGIKPALTQGGTTQ